MDKFSKAQGRKGLTYTVSEGLELKSLKAQLRALRGGVKNTTQKEERTSQK